MFTGDVMLILLLILKSENASYLSEETVDVERDYNLSATGTLQEVNTVLPEREYLRHGEGPQKREMVCQNIKTCM